jgi:hypothetical protein
MVSFLVAGADRLVAGAPPIITPERREPQWRETAGHARV